MMNCQWNRSGRYKSKCVCVRACARACVCVCSRNNLFFISLIRERELRSLMRKWRWCVIHAPFIQILLRNSQRAD